MSATLSLFDEPVSTWERVDKFTPAAARLADRHYSRRKVGSPQFMPPGQTLVLLRPGAVFGWWRPHPASGIKAMNGYDGWTCTIFRREFGPLASELVLAAEVDLALRHDCGPSGMLTYVWDAKLRSSNPGCCFKHAGWRRIGKSADKRKTLLWKPLFLAGIPACGMQLPWTPTPAGVPPGEREPAPRPTHTEDSR